VPLKLTLGRKLSIAGVSENEPVSDAKEVERYEAIVKPESQVERVKAFRDQLGIDQDMPITVPTAITTPDGWFKYKNPQDVPIEKLFPAPSFRPYQKEAILDILTAFFPVEKGGKGKRFVVLEGPTGSGKSLLASTVASAASGSYLSTSQRMLQDQYAKDFVKVSLDGMYECCPMPEAEAELQAIRDQLKGTDDSGVSDELSAVTKPKKKKGERKASRSLLRVNANDRLKKATEKLFGEAENYLAENPSVIMLKGKGNYLCQRYGTPSNALFTCATAPCMTESNDTITKTIKAQCFEAGVCPYYKERSRAIVANQTIVNFKNLILLSMFYVFKQRPLMIADECHLLEDVLFDFVDTTVSRKTLKPILSLLSPDNLDLLQSGLETEDDVMAFVQEVVSPVIKNKMALMEAGDYDIDDPDVTDEDGEYQTLSKLSYKIKFLSEFAGNGGTLVLIPNMVKSDNHSEPVQDGYKIKPLSVAQMFDKVFAPGRQVLLMSATILDYQSFCNTLGIPLEETEFIRIPSTFPVENHPLYFRSVGSMGYKTIQQTLPKMCDEIERILEFHKDQKGLIHTVNFNPITKYLYDWFSRKYPRLIFHMPDESKFDAIRRHMQSPEPTVLVGPGYGEGIDLKDDLSRFQIFTKVPYLSLADPVIKKRMELDAKWYAWKTAMALVQAFGRSCRSETDFCVSYMLDENFRYFWTKNKDVLPDDFRAHVLVED
jgi:Rad3-related DNA helicase